METQSNRPHRANKEKKTPKKGERNPKAFAFANPGRLAKQAIRSSDIKEKRFHVPQVDRIPNEPPPTVCAIVGPPGVGKTTLLKSLVRRFSKQTLSHPTGPITVVINRKKRITFIEVPSDSLAAQIDACKVADISLILIDGNYGFEMETMEFLNALSSHGMPGNCFGVLTHLDLFKKQSTLKAAKKRLKHRFWSELYQGAKLFYLSGVINGRYPDREVMNLSRFLSVMKNPRPLVWRNTHAYCLADRFLDITDPTEIEENPKCDRSIALYGYLRGTNFSQGARVHVPGVGDLDLKEIEALPDPCPTPHLDQAIAKASGKSGRKRLGDKQKVLFAPMSDVGGVLVDKDAVYIDVKTNTFDRDLEDQEERGLGEQLMMSLQGERRLLGQVDGGVRLFQGGQQIQQNDENDFGRSSKRKIRHFDDVEDQIESGVEIDEGFVDGEETDEDVDNDDDGTDDEMEIPEHNGHFGFSGKDRLHDAEEGLVLADSDSDMGSMIDEDQAYYEEEEDDESEDADEEDGALRWKENMAENARRSHNQRIAFRTTDLERLLYDLSVSPRDVVLRWRGELASKVNQLDDDEDDFLRKTNVEDEQDNEDRIIPRYHDLESKWGDKENLQSIRRRFIREPLASGANALQPDGSDDREDGTDPFDESDVGDGEFEDLEAPDSETAVVAATPLSLEEEREHNARRKAELRLRFEEEDREGTGNARTVGDEEFGEDEWYDAQKAAMAKQQEINKTEFTGAGSGTYARIVLANVPYEFTKSFNPRYPIVIGGLAPTEERLGWVSVRIKKHRWFGAKVLKSHDPIVMSLGWRRFQVTPMYTTSDNRVRERLLKYTPEHNWCGATFYGPLVAPNTGFCCVQSFSNSNPGFRIAATGVVSNVDAKTEIVKKLKLVGYPYQIYQRSAFIKSMFNSAIEVSKFEGASIKTVSGIRGQIKRALSKPEGCFRATFEDKILMSDIIILRSWVSVRPHRFYNPVTNLLDAPSTGEEDSKQDGTSNWNAMRLTGQVRATLNLPTPKQRDSAYGKVERSNRHFNPLRVPKALQKELPFKSQIKQQTSRKAGPTYLQKRAVVLGGEEKKARDLMQKLMTLRNEKVEKRARKQEERRSVYRKKVEENLEKKGEREKKERDEFWRKEGRKRQAGSEGGGGKRRRT